MDGPLTSFFVDRNYTKEKNKRPKGVKKGVVCFESSSQKRSTKKLFKEPFNEHSYQVYSIQKRKLRTDKSFLTSLGLLIHLRISKQQK
jgi:hypothetical protein